ncbi:hypothetical protein ONS96_006529 [Cadophora gregata f. sp. sojae]|nr:hypothetical protein ONS96_006529 [Cadophora gregata f. sp. sojae]
MGLNFQGSFYAAAGHSHGLIIGHSCNTFEAVRPTIQNWIFDHLEIRAELYEEDEFFDLSENGDWVSEEESAGEEEFHDPEEELFALH